MRISDWSSDVCSSDLHIVPQRLVWSALRASSGLRARTAPRLFQRPMVDGRRAIADGALSCRTRLRARSVGDRHHRAMRSEEHTSELQSLMLKSYTVF